MCKTLESRAAKRACGYAGQGLQTDHPHRVEHGGFEGDLHAETLKKCDDEARGCASRDMLRFSP